MGCRDSEWVNEVFHISKNKQPWHFANTQFRYNFSFVGRPQCAGPFAPISGSEKKRFIYSRLNNDRVTMVMILSKNHNKFKTRC